MNINIPDYIIDKCKKIIPDEKEMESFIVNAVSYYIEEIGPSGDDDPFLDFITDGRNFRENDENLTDISANHDKHLY